MLCQNCKSREANVYYTKIINGERIDIRLCDICAKDGFNVQYHNPFKINDFLTGVIEFPIATISNTILTNEQVVAKCQKCGLTFEEFKQNGILGCSSCYLHFREKLRPVLKRLHGNTKHNGKYQKNKQDKIVKEDQLQKLKNELNIAIKEEKYEDAAKIRDRIKRIENVQNTK